MQLENKIIQILLCEGEAMTLKSISDLLKIPISEIESNLSEVKNKLYLLDLNLMETKNEIAIVLHKEVSQILEKQNNKDLIKPLSESALQTLAVIIYKENSTKAEIDFVRGVDSSRSIKTLLLRGLIQKDEIKSKKIYNISIDTLKYLGLNNETEIPNKEFINKGLNRLMHEE